MSDAPTVRLVPTRRHGRLVVAGAPLSRAASLWVLLHGYGQQAHEILSAARALDDGTRALVAPEGLSRFYLDAPAPGFHREARVGASWMTRENRETEIADTLDWLDTALASVRQDGGEGLPVHVLGFSQGAVAASRWVGHGRVDAARLILWGAAIAPELELGPQSPLRRQPVVLVLGDRDRYVGPEAVAAERARLDAAGFPYRVMGFAGGHRLDDDTLRALAGEAP